MSTGDKVEYKSKLPPPKLGDPNKKYTEFRPVPKPSLTKKVKGRKPKETKDET